LARGVTAATPASRSWLPVQSLDPSWYRPYGLGDPALPSAIPSAVRFSSRRTRRPQLSSRTNLSSGFALRQSITQRILAGRPQPPAPLMGFVSLQRSRIRRSTCRGFAEPATFRPQGLVTLSAACSLRARAGLVSYRRRSWDSPFGAFSSREVSTRLHVEGPTCRFSCRCYRRRRQRAGPAGRGSWASTLARVPGDQRGISAPGAGYSHGLCPSRVFRQRP
jgi:hypothetical protein